MLINVIDKYREAGITIEVKEGNLLVKAPKNALTLEQKEFLRANKEDIIRVLTERKTDNVPLTDIQSAYFLGRTDSFLFGGVTCQVYFELLYDDLDEQKANEAFRQVIKNHEMLCATIEKDGTWHSDNQVWKDYNIQFVDCPNVYDKESEELESIREGYANWKSEIGKWPFFHFGVTKFKDKSVLHLVMDFMIADWNSIWIIVREFEQIYFGKMMELIPEAISFREYLNLEKEFQMTVKYKEDRKFWLDKIVYFPSYPAVPTQLDKIEKGFTRKTYKLSKEKWDYFASVAKKANCTPTVAVLTAYALTLAEWSREERFGLNITLLNRMPLAEGVNQIVGDFTSVTLMDTSLAYGESFLSNMKKIQVEMNTNLDHSSYSGVKVMRDMTAEKGKEESMFPYVFTGSIGLVQSGELEAQIGDYGISQTPQVFIDCQAMDSPNGLDVNFDIRKGVFLLEIENAIIDYFSRIMDMLSSDEYSWQRVWDGAIPKSQQKVRKYVNNTAKNIPYMALHKRVEKSATENPENIAIIDSEGELIYKALWEKVKALAGELSKLGAHPQDKIGILLPKGRNQIIAVLAILSINAVYVPLDEKQPINRVKLIIDKTRMNYIVGQAPSNNIDLGVKFINLNEVNNAENVEIIDALENDLAYIIFTSGSTGVPKGVEITHGSADNTIQDVNDRLGIGSSDRVLAMSRLNFDLSVYDVFGLLSVGGAVVFVDNDKYLDAKHWIDVIEHDQVTIWNTVPALFKMLLEAAGQHSVKVGLKNILLSGDWIPVNFRELKDEWCPKATLYSLGGATEGSIWSNIYEVTEADDRRPSIPYGRPLSNQAYRVVDSKLRDCPDYVVGELCILGKGVANGYCNEKELTLAQFVTTDDGRRMYRTGDFGYYESDGTLIFCGRHDSQIKFHGYRIEIGEIESILNKYDGIKECKVCLNPIDKNSLVGIIKGEKMFNEQDLKDYLGENLPEYMIPLYFINIDKIGLTANGKVDMKSLEALIENSIVNKSKSTSCEDDDEVTELIKEIHLIFEENLGVMNISYSANVYDYGADSLVLSRIVGKVRDMLVEKYSHQCTSQDISFDRLLREILNKPTTLEFGTFVENLLEKKTQVKAVTEKKNEKLGLFTYKGGNKEGEVARLVFHAGLGTMNCFRFLLPHLLEQNLGPVYGITIQDMDRYCSIPANELVVKLGTEYANTIVEKGIKKVQLIGYCMGGLIALETARELQRLEIEVEDFLLVDSAPVPYDIEESIALELVFITNYFITVEDVYSEITNQELMEIIMHIFSSYGKRLHKEDFYEIADKSKYKKATAFLKKMESIPIEQRFKDYVATMERLGRGEASYEMLLSNYHLYIHSFQASCVDAEPYFGNIRFLEATEPLDFIFTQTDDMKAYWNDRVIGQIDYIPIGGNHVTCVEDEENAKTVAEYAKKGLENLE